MPAGSAVHYSRIAFDFTAVNKVIFNIPVFRDADDILLNDLTGSGINFFLQALFFPFPVQGFVFFQLLFFLSGYRCLTFLLILVLIDLTFLYGFGFLVFTLISFSFVGLLFGCQTCAQ